MLVQGISRLEGDAKTRMTPREYRRRGELGGYNGIQVLREGILIFFQSLTVAGRRRRFFLERGDPSRH